MKYLNKITLSVSVFVLSLSVYILTLYPDLAFTDSGELAAVCCSLGIAHPTGYPLFTILGYLWSLLPLPFTKIYSLNLFASLLTSLSAVFFFLSNYNLFSFLIKTNHNTKHNKADNPKVLSNDKNIFFVLLLSFINALVYSFSATIWEQAITIEVYSLELLIANIIIYLMFYQIFNSEHSTKYFYLASLFLGLGFANHLTTVLLVPAILYLFFVYPNFSFSINKKKLSYLLLLLIPFALGLSIYFYLPLRSAAMPEINWGWVHRGFDKFLYHVQGKQYQVWMFSSPELWSENLSKIIALIPYQLAWIGIIPSLLGLYFSFKYCKTLFWFLVILTITTMFYTLNYSIHDIATYFSFIFISLIILSGIGIYGLLKNQKNLIYIYLLVPVLSLIINYNENNNSNNYSVPEYTNILIQNLEPNAIIISSQWDYWCSAFLYKQIVEQQRKDIVLVEQELLRRTWYLQQFKNWYPNIYSNSKQEATLYLEELEKFESGKLINSNLIQRRYVELINSFIEKNYNKRPIYITYEVFQKETEIAKNYEKIPMGFAAKLKLIDNSNNSFKEYNPDFSKLNLDKFLASTSNKTDYLTLGIKETASMNVTYIGRYAIFANNLQLAHKAFNLALIINPKNQFAQNGLNSLTK